VSVLLKGGGKGVRKGGWGGWKRGIRPVGGGNQRIVVAASRLTVETPFGKGRGRSQGGGWGVKVSKSHIKGCDTRRVWALLRRPIPIPEGPEGEGAFGSDGRKAKKKRVGGSLSQKKKELSSDSEGVRDTNTVVNTGKSGNITQK